MIFNDKFLSHTRSFMGVSDFSKLYREDFEDIFFVPYEESQSPLLNLFKRTGSIVTAPIAASIITVDLLLEAVKASVMLAFSLVTLNTDMALDKFSHLLLTLLITGVISITGALSPIINTVDLIGGGVVSACNFFNSPDDENSRAWVRYRWSGVYNSPDDENSRADGDLASTMAAESGGGCDARRGMYMQGN